MAFRVERSRARDRPPPGPRVHPIPARRPRGIARDGTRHRQRHRVPGRRGVPHELAFPQAFERGRPYATVKLAAAPEDFATPRDLPSTSRHTNRFPYARTPPRRRQGDRSTTAAPSLGRASWPWILAWLSGGRRRCLPARSPRANCTTGWLRACTVSRRRAVAEGDGLDVGTLDLPPGGAAFLKATRNWSVIAFESAGRPGVGRERHRPFAQSTAPRLPRRDQRPCERDCHRGKVWTGLNARGLHIHRSTPRPTSRCASPPVAGLARCRRRWLSELPALLGLAKGERLHLILRVGWPKFSAPPRSRRLPLERVFGTHGRRARVAVSRWRSPREAGDGCRRVVAWWRDDCDRRRSARPVRAAFTPRRLTRILSASVAAMPAQSSHAMAVRQALCRPLKSTAEASTR